MKENKEVRRKRAQAVFKKLEKLYPEPQTALVHRNPFELLVATVLSAQCTDERVNKVTPELFDKAPTPELLSTLKLAEIERIIRSVNYFKTKAKNLKALGKQLFENFDSQVPTSREELQSLPGVGRKTANVVLANAFHVPALVVDTHVTRLAQRLGWSRQKDPQKIEAELCDLFTPSQWRDLSHFLILHGRAVCKARSPNCADCSLLSLCPSGPKS